MSDPRLSPLWDGAHGQFQRLQQMLVRLANLYDTRLGDLDNRNQRIRIYAADIDGIPITSANSLPAAVLDDVLLALEGIATRRREENLEQGLNHQRRADSRVRFIDDHTGEDRESVQAVARTQYEESARRAEQPDDAPR